MTEIENNGELMENIKEMIKEGKIDAAVDIIGNYLNLSNEENYINRLENIIEIVSPLHGGKTVIRFLIENLIIDIPSLLENLSKRDNLLRYSFLLSIKSLVEEESDLFLPHSEKLLKSEDPNVREALLQLLIFIAGGEKGIEEESLIESISEKLMDDKDYVIEKAIQTLKAIGKKNPSIITRVLKKYVKECSENEDLKKGIDEILKSIVSLDKIEEIVEEEESAKDKIAEEVVQKEKILADKEIELKEKEKELENKEVELEIKEILSDFDSSNIEKEKQLKEKEIELHVKEVELKEKELKLELEGLIEKDKEPEDFIKDKIEILDKELELKKKDLLLKKKRLELEEEEKALEEIEIREKEKVLQKKKEILEKQKELAQVEFEIEEKQIQEKEQQILEQEIKRVEKKLDETEEKKKDEL
jgi:hypothetical protein